MQTKDHLALGRYLSQKAGLQSYGKTAFIIGNTMPDINVFSYLSGFKSFVPAGHHCKFALAKADRIIKRLGNTDDELLYFYLLGVLMHYLADAFTYSHNDNFPCKYSPHAAYEKKLHSEFKKALAKNGQTVSENVSNAAEFIGNMQKRYNAEDHRETTDLEYILSVTQTVTLTMCEKRKTAEWGKKFSHLRYGTDFLGENHHKARGNARN